MQYDEILEMVNELALRRIELSAQMQDYVSHLSQDAQDTLEKYHNTMYILSGHQIRYLYLQGAKDCVSLLRELGVIR